ncbi:sugar porter family MFS transporter [Hirschia litorea]|uniref:Sugar porter family MFS transporter n=1 Tax=Hirschia litorea TaxID=1199156 RepID=A0ABW2IP74_9PROT
MNTTTTGTPPGDLKAGNISFLLLISCVATIGGFLFGFDSGVINGTIDGLRAAFNSSDAGSGFQVASMLLGCAVGAALAGTLSDKFGRRSMMIVAAVFFTVSAWGSGVSSDSLQFIIYRLLGGLAVGAASVMAPAYIAEVAPANLRGKMATIQQVAIIFGLFIAFLSNYLIAQSAGSSTQEWLMGFEAWRWMYWMELIPAIVFLLALLAIPESPRFLVAQEKTQAAHNVFEKISGTAQATIQVAEVEASLASDHKPKLSDLFNNGRLRPIVWVGIGLAVFQQFVGINIIFYYGAVLWQAAGFTESDALLINVLSGGLSIGAVMAALLLVDRIGRKPLLLIGSIGMAVSLAVVAFTFSTGELTDAGGINLTSSMGLIALIAANVYVVFFNASWGPVMWVMLGEMFPNQIRGSGLAVAGFFQWVANFVISMSFPIMIGTASIGLVGAYGFYTLSAFISVAFVWYFVKETKGKKLEDMVG